MELRSSRKQNESEYKELKITLNGMGLYEEGMKLQEMRHIIDALQQSVSETEMNFLEINMERAMRESEMDFMPFNNERVFNSTMDMSSSPCTSPDIPLQRIVVQADVHHPLDWSPTYTEEERLQRKRLATSSNVESNNLLHCIHKSNEILEPWNAKRIQQSLEDIQKCLEVTTTSQQSLAIIDFRNDSNNECQDDLTSPHAITEENNFSGHEAVGTISMRRPGIDSGLNIPHSMLSLFSPSSLSSSSTTPSPLSSPSPPSLLLLPSLLVPSPTVNHSNQNSSNSFIDVVGPVSLRRPIHDSGVASYNETANTSSSSWEYHVSNRDSMDSNRDSLNSLPNIPQHESDVEQNNTSAPLLMFPTVFKNAPIKELCGDNVDDNEISEPSH